MREWKQWEIKILKQKDFPNGLKRVRPEVKQIYYRGEWDKKIFDKSVAVVGSRRITEYGKRITERLVGELTEAGYTIVSGFMYGVDAAAHRECLASKGRTVAVLGSGLDCLTPAENDNLYTKILESDGLVVSEFKPKQEAKLWTFPYRNRIVAGLSRAVIVVEAGEKSGSLITAKWAFRQNKKVLAVPGRIDQSQSAGTNWLIRNGAVLVRNANDILEELGEEDLQGRTSQVDICKIRYLTAAEQGVVEVLKESEMEADKIARKLGRPITQINILLSELCLKGVVEESGGKFMLGLNYAD
ncbi:MAG: DNA-processing protein DprA [Candidatus Beckwithbacteria bacterium]